MKNPYLFFALLFLVKPAFSQVEFAPAGAEWYYKSTSGYTSEIFAYNGFSYLQYTGDTMIDGLTCKKICDRLYRVQNGQQPSCGQNSIVHFMYQRADSIFEYAPGSSLRNRFLFRNNYKVGDVVFALGGDDLIVQSIDTLEFNGRTVRRFMINSSASPLFPTAACYDLFGPKNGLFSYDMWGLTVDGGIVDLRCYQDASFPQANVSNENCDAVLNQSTPHIRVELLPNPVHAELVMNVTAFPWTDDMRFTIYDASGRFIMEDRLEETRTKVPVAHLSNGIYLCVFRDGNSIFHQKFVKN